MNKANLLTAALLLAACPAGLYAQNTDPATPAPPAAPVTVTPAAPAAPVIPAAPTVTLRLKFTPGQTLYYAMTVDTDGMLQMGQTGGGMPLKNHMTMLMHQTVKDIRASDGAATIDAGIDSMTMMMNGQAVMVPPSKVGQMKSVGTLVILPTGKTLSFTPNPALVKSQAMPGMDMSHSNPFGSMGQFPDAPLKPGDTWKSALSMGMMGMQATSGFALGSLDTTGGKTVAVIAQTTTGTFDMTGGKEATAAPAGMKMVGKIDGTGTLRFDVDAGAIESQTSQANITMTMTPPGATAPMKMLMKAGTTMKRTTAPVPATAAPAAPASPAPVQ